MGLVTDKPSGPEQTLTDPCLSLLGPLKTLGRKIQGLSVSDVPHFPSSPSMPQRGKSNFSRKHFFKVLYTIEKLGFPENGFSSHRINPLNQPNWKAIAFAAAHLTPPLSAHPYMCAQAHTRDLSQKLTSVAGKEGLSGTPTPASRLY